MGKVVNKNPFKKPVKRYYLGKLFFGTPYMYPRKFVPTILEFRKVKPKYNRNYNFDLFNYNISVGFPIWITWYKLFWKDKYQLPRFEYSPAFYIYFFKWQFCIFYNSPDGDNSRYYEQFLWWKYYCNEDIEKARNTWSWIDSHTKKSTWNDKFLK